MFSSHCCHVGICVQIRERVRKALAPKTTAPLAAKRAVGASKARTTSKALAGPVDVASLKTAFQRYDPGIRKASLGSKQRGSAVDTDAGTVSMLEFERALISIGVAISEGELAEVVTDLNIENSGRVRYEGKISISFVIRGSVTVDWRVL